MMGWKSFAGGCAATLISLAVPLGFILFTQEKAYLVAWPIFGTSNQMLASLTLLALAAWLVRLGKRVFYVVAPMIFMMAMTIVALILQIKPFLAGLPNMLKGGQIKPDIVISGVCGIVLLILSSSMIFIAARTLLLRIKVPK
jgi:carbon starvation protein